MEQTNEFLRESLYKNNYIFIKNFIDEERATDICKKFSKAKRNIDNVTPNSTSLYNFMPSLELLCEKTSVISDIMGEYVLPTYTFTRQYMRNGELPRHRDRGACEIAITVHLGSDGSHKWPIWITTPSGENKSICFDPGDAVMYFGCNAWHWREKYNGRWYNQVFLHYVTSNGNNSHAYFDRKVSPRK